MQDAGASNSYCGFCRKKIYSKLYSILISGGSERGLKNFCPLGGAGTWQKMIEKHLANLWLLQLQYVEVLVHHGGIHRGKCS